MRNILLVDDHPLVRQGIARVLLSAIPSLRITEAASAEEALEHAGRQPWDAVTLDLSMPGIDGLELLRALTVAIPSVPILVVSMHPTDQFARRALQAGAAGYIAKSSAPQDIVSAVITILKGGRYLPANVEELCTTGDAPPHESLSDREYQVLRMIGQGRTVSEIATQLRLSTKTVSTYRARVLQKMGIHTSAEIMHYVISRRLV